MRPFKASRSQHEGNPNAGSNSSELHQLEYEYESQAHTHAQIQTQTHLHPQYQSQTPILISEASHLPTPSPPTDQSSARYAEFRAPVPGQNTGSSFEGISQERPAYPATNTYSPEQNQRVRQALNQSQPFENSLHQSSSRQNPPPLLSPVQYEHTSQYHSSRVERPNRVVQESSSGKKPYDKRKKLPDLAASLRPNFQSPFDYDPYHSHLSRRQERVVKESPETSFSSRRAEHVTKGNPDFVSRGQVSPESAASPGRQDHQATVDSGNYQHGSSSHGPEYVIDRSPASTMERRASSENENPTPARPELQSASAYHPSQSSSSRQNNSVEESQSSSRPYRQISTENKSAREPRYQCSSDDSPPQGSYHTPACDFEGSNPTSHRPRRPVLRSDRSVLEEYHQFVSDCSTPGFITEASPSSPERLYRQISPEFAPSAGPYRVAPPVFQPLAASLGNQPSSDYFSGQSTSPSSSFPPYRSVDVTSPSRLRNQVLPEHVVSAPAYASSTVSSNQNTFRQESGTPIARPSPALRVPTTHHTPLIPSPSHTAILVEDPLAQEAEDNDDPAESVISYTDATSTPLFGAAIIPGPLPLAILEDPIAQLVDQDSTPPRSGPEPEILPRYVSEEVTRQARSQRTTPTKYAPWDIREIEDSFSRLPVVEETSEGQSSHHNRTYLQPSASTLALSLRQTPRRSPRPPPRQSPYSPVTRGAFAASAPGIHYRINRDEAVQFLEAFSHCLPSDTRVVASIIEFGVISGMILSHDGRIMVAIGQWSDIKAIVTPTSEAAILDVLESVKFSSAIVESGDIETYERWPPLIVLAEDNEVCTFRDRPRGRFVAVKNVHDWWLKEGGEWVKQHCPCKKCLEELGRVGRRQAAGWLDGACDEDEGEEHRGESWTVEERPRKRVKTGRGEVRASPTPYQALLMRVLELDSRVDSGVGIEAGPESPKVVNYAFGLDGTGDEQEDGEGGNGSEEHQALSTGGELSENWERCSETSSVISLTDSEASLQQYQAEQDHSGSRLEAPLGSSPPATATTITANSPPSTPPANSSQGQLSNYQVLSNFGFDISLRDRHRLMMAARPRGGSMEIYNLPLSLSWYQNHLCSVMQDVKVEVRAQND